MAARVKTSPRKEPRQQRAQATVDAILAATAQVLLEHGYEGANTNRIAEQAGVSVGSLYQYFPNKESLVAALVERHADTIWAIFVKESAEVWNASIADAVTRVIHAIFEAHMIAPELHQVLSEQVPRTGKMARIREVAARAIELTRTYLDTHKNAIAPRDTALAAWVIVHTVETLVHEARERHAPPREAAEAEAVRLVLRYLGVEKAVKSAS
jgi:AcrR family transcriptional regulator